MKIAILKVFLSFTSKGLSQQEKKPQSKLHAWYTPEYSHCMIYFSQMPILDATTMMVR